MPLFMDVHNVDGGVSAGDVADAHQADLAIQDAHGVNYLRYILDAQCELGRRHGHPDTRAWVETMQNLTARTGMRDLALRSLRHGAAPGHQGDAAAAAMLEAELQAFR